MTRETITAKNDFHNTEAKLVLKDGWANKRQLDALGKKLCASDCICGRTQFFNKAGKRLLVEDQPDGSAHFRAV